MNRAHVKTTLLWLTCALLPISAGAGCDSGTTSSQDKGSASDAAATRDVARPDMVLARDGTQDSTRLQLDCGVPSGTTPTLSCDPAKADDSSLCDCLADLVCKKIYQCLAPCVIAAKPSSCNWSSVATCTSKLSSDCKDDVKSGMKPSDFGKCVQDAYAQACPAFHSFSSLNADFPASCAGLKATDSALCIKN
jgi:hypothetical protein